MPEPTKPEIEKIKAATRELGCEEDEGCWDDQLRKVAKPKPKLASDAE